MTHQPRSVEEIENEIQSDVEGSIVKLTNFFEQGLNGLWINAFAQVVHQLDVKNLATELSTMVNYAGNDELTAEDLAPLNVDTSKFDMDDLNSYMHEQHLEEIGALMGVSRNPGEEATGEVTIQTATDSTKVFEGLEVSTVPDEQGNRQTFLVDADGDGTITESSSNFVTPSSGQTEVTVDVIADDVGTEYNVGSGSITRLVDPDVGIEGVNNNAETTGGTDQQSIESLREDVKSAILENAGGGTAAGIEGSIESNVSGVSDVELDEFFSEQPPYVDVIVDGGSDVDVEAEIDDTRPTGVEHLLVRPEQINVGIRTELVGTDVDTGALVDEIEDFLLDLTLSDSFLRSKLVQRILNTSPNTDDIGSLTALVTSISEESHTYSTGTNIYELDFAPLGLAQNDRFFYRTDTDKYDLAYADVTDGTTVVTAEVDGESTDLTDNTDYDLIDDTGDTGLDTIDFSVGGDDPDDRTLFNVEYEHSSVSIDSTITDESGDTYTQGTDWQLIDNDSDGLNDSIDWSIGGSTPDDGEKWFVDYTPNRTIAEDLRTEVREKISADSTSIEVIEVSPA